MMNLTDLRSAIFSSSMALSLTVTGSASGAIASSLDLDLNENASFKVVLHEKIDGRKTQQAVYASAITATFDGGPGSQQWACSPFIAFSLDLFPRLKNEGYW